MSRYFLGVDGGQSSTTALIGDGAGRLLGSGTAGPCDHVRRGAGREKFARALNGSIQAACGAAGLPADGVRFESACLGLSGGPDDRRAIVDQAVAADKLFLTTDAWIALAGATGGEPGIVAIAGTGSIAFGRNAAGLTARAGGWGYIYGDEGGAFDIVRRALRAALRAEEGWGPATSLARKLAGATGTASANELLHLFYTDDYPRDRVAAMAPLVDEAAVEGDRQAFEIIRGTAERLARLAAAVRVQLFQKGEPVTVAHVGGAFHSTLLLHHFRSLVESDPDCRCTGPLYVPAMGALIEAWRASGLSPQKG